METLWGRIAESGKIEGENSAIARKPGRHRLPVEMGTTQPVHRHHRVTGAAVVVYVDEPQGKVVELARHPVRLTLPLGFPPSYHAPVRFLLVSTYELGHQPWHLASPAARLLAEGHEVRCLDLAVEPWDVERFAWAERVAFSVPMHTAMRLAVEASARLRSQRPEVPIAFYGLYGAIGFDATVSQQSPHRLVGEYEDHLAAWAAGLPSLPLQVDLGNKEFLMPARQLLPPLARYARLEIDGEQRLAGYVEASHGCRHRCRHCPIPAVYDGRYRTTGLEQVVADVAQLVEMGARHVTFGDPDFLNAPRYAGDVLHEVSATFPQLTFDVTVKVEHIIDHDHLWREWAERGVIFVVSAFESTNDKILKLLDKGHTARGMARAVEVLNRVGIGLRPSWLPFTPWTEPGDLPEILTFLDEHDLLGSTDPVQLSIRLLIPEGSLLLRLPELAPYLSSYDPKALSYRWQGDESAERLQQDLAVLAEKEGDREQVMTAMWQRVMGRDTQPMSSRRIAPRLTEDWFCCAEPTSGQLLVLGDQPR